ncbi:lichenicidin alpha family lanthipeptide, partial [Bacillus licheniformis]
HPAGNILKELQEEEQHSIAGGTITLSTCAILSKPLGNNGYLCTVTKECMPSCN